MQYLAFKMKPIFDKISFKVRPVIDKVRYKVHSINDYVRAYIYSIKTYLTLKRSSPKNKILYQQHIKQMINDLDKKFSQEK